MFALNHGANIMREMGVNVSTVRAGKANMFLSPLFRQIFATVTGAQVEVYNTDGAQGAARGAGLGAGLYESYEQALSGLICLEKIDPDSTSRRAYQEIYQQWVEVVQKFIDVNHCGD